MTKRRRRKKNSGLRDTLNILTSAALLVIAVLMVIFVVFYIKNNSFLGGTSLFNKKAQTTEAESLLGTTDDETIDIDLSEERFGLIRLSNGDIMYAMDAKEAAEYDEEHVLKVPADSPIGKSTDIKTAENGASDKASVGGEGVSSKNTAASTKEQKYRYYLADSWLDKDSNLYHFDAEGLACTDTFKEGAFIFSYDEDGILKKISYNKNYSVDSQTSQSDMPGLVQTKTLWAYMNSSRKLGDYTAVMYKKTTDSLSHVLGGDAAVQYASPYAYSIIGSKIYYLAVPAGASSDISGNSTSNSGSHSDNSASGNDTALKSIAGKLFCMAPGADYREIAAENAEGFKVLQDKNSSGMPIVYYYDGTQIRRSVTLKKDNSMVVLSEDADYSLDISEGDKAYLTVAGSQRVMLQSASFKAGNFTYSLAADGEILKVAEKPTVSTGGYVYSVENGEAFGTRMARVIRKDKSGNREIISGEFEGAASNLHYDYDSSSIIAEYNDNSGNGGLLKITLDGDVDFIEDSRSAGGKVVLYAIEGGKAVYKTTEDGSAKFKTARIGASVPIAAGVDPIPANVSDEPNAAAAAGDAHSSSGSDGKTTVETGSAPENNSRQDYDTAVGHAPGENGAAQKNTPGGA